MSTTMSVIPDDEHLERYLEYPRPAHPLMKEVFVEAMEDRVIEHLEHGPRTKCVFRRIGVSGQTQPAGDMQS
jgi:hypothetical protein